MLNSKRMQKALLLALVMLTAWLLPLFGLAGDPLEVQAASVDYPVQLMNLATKDNSKVLTENGTKDGSTLSVKALGSTLAPSWRFDRVGSDGNGTFFKICNAESGRVLTPQNYNVAAGANVIVYGSESAKSQHWYAVPVSKDRLGNDLCYKIVNYSDTSLALTQGTSGMTLASYTGADNQLWLLNPDGLQGFAGYCKNDNLGSVKAADIGGLFGETVEVSTFDELKKYATSDTPYTIVVKSNISVSTLTKDSSGRYYCPDGRIYVHSNKTIIGSYGAHTLYNVQFCTSSNNGTGNNIIIKNFELQHDSNSNGNDSIVVYFGSGENLWVDHCTFVGHSDYNTASTGLPDWDKFLACCYDADYCTVSDSSFGLHEYGVILGYPDDSESNYSKYDGYPNMSLISNKFKQTLTRGPGLMRWGYYHSLNNFVDTFSMAFTVQSDCKIFSENSYFTGGGNVCCDWGQSAYKGYFTDSGSIFNKANRTGVGQGSGNNLSYAGECIWRPNTNYDYISLTAENAKNYCADYSGVQNSAGNWMYLRYGSKGVPSAGYNEAPSGVIAENFADGTAFMIKNVNSSLFLEVADGKAANGANIQQWAGSGSGANGEGEWNVWRLYSAGDGYYYVYSALGDGKTFVLDVAGKKADNGTNLDLYQYNGGDNQKFKFVKNADGSYKIYTKISNDVSVVEVSAGSLEHGGNVQQWEMNGYNCQDWSLVPAVLPISGKLVKGLGVKDTDNAADWNIAYDAALGGKVFGDRDFTITSLPDKLAGAEQILTACDSKAFSGDLGKFTAGADIVVYIALDTRVANIPAWMSDYTDTGSTVGISNDVVFKVYSKNFSAGESVTLGTNGQSGNTVNYTVFVKEAEKEQVVDVNGDGEFNIADLVALNNFVLGKKDSGIVNWEAGDLNSDGRLNSIDLVLMRKLITEKTA